MHLRIPVFFLLIIQLQTLVLHAQTPATAKDSLPVPPGQAPVLPEQAPVAPGRAPVSPGQAGVVLLDHYYNNEFKKDKDGKIVPFHYTWTDTTNSGYSMLGQLFESKGFLLEEQTSSAKTLSDHEASIYVIVDPDTEKETARPHYISDDDIQHIASWVKKGGILVILGNDSGNTEYFHFNKLAARFGLMFNLDCKNRVINDQFAQGTIITPANDAVFGDSRRIFIKEYSSLQLIPPARAILRNGDHVVMASAKFGKGLVVAMGDPWIYNEYFDHRRLPGSFQNREAAEAWVDWLISKTPKLSR